MAKINIRDIESISELLETNLSNHLILDYDIVTFKNGRGRYARKTELLVVKSFYNNQPAHLDKKVSFTTFLIQRETLCNSIQKLIKQ